MVVRLDWKRFEAALPDMTAALVMSMVASDM
jgi:hypothetical protein